MAISHAASPNTPLSSPAIVSRIRTALDLSQERLAGVLGVSVRTVVRWEREGDLPPALEWERLTWITDLVALAESLTEREDVPAWFATPKQALGGRRPLDLLGSFRGLQDVRGLLESIRWGSF